MPAPAGTTNVNEGLWRFGGMYGSAWRDGVMLAEVIDCTGTVEVARFDVPLVGATRAAHKPGREAREGTMRVQKMDSYWELEIFQFLSTNLHQRRVNRDKGVPSLRPFQLHLKYDDPDALGVEEWMLDGCIIWRLPLGFSIGDDIVEREFPITWEQETPLHAFKIDNSSGTPTANYQVGYGSTPPTPET